MNIDIENDEEIDTAMMIMIGDGCFPGALDL